MVYSPYRLLFTRNLAVAFVNGLVTLVILLIAPLGLAAVMINTILVMLSTVTVGVCGDLVIRWLLQGAAQPIFPTGMSSVSVVNPETVKKIERVD